VQAHLSRFAESVRRSAAALPYSPDEAERERRQYGAHADPLTGLPLTADPELDNVLETTIRR
jgi:branched-subunit amino acid aminotransferase/4-amino-4-deoxychorismate lyase